MDRRAALLDGLVADARRVGSAATAELVRERERLREEQVRGRAFTALVRTEVDGLERDGQFAAAHGALRKFYEEEAKGLTRSVAAQRMSATTSSASAGTATASGTSWRTPALSEYTARAASSVRKGPRMRGGA